MVRLTDRQVAGTLALRDRWAAIEASTERCDRPAAAAAVRRAHRAAGLAEPAIVWTESPLAGAVAALLLPRLTGPAADGQPTGAHWDGLRAALAGLPDAPGGRAGRALWDDPVDRVLGAVAPWSSHPEPGSLTWPMWRRLEELVEAAGWTDMHHLVSAAALERLARPALAEVDERTRGWPSDRVRRRRRQPPLRPRLRRQLGIRLQSRLHAAFSDALSPTWHGLELVCELRALDIAGQPPCPRLLATADALATVGWWWPRERAAVLADRPTELHRDRGGRLHRADGPAARWADGFAVHAWRGTAVPADLVTGAGWAAPRILDERNAEVRRCAIERLGWDRFVAQAQLRRVGEDQPDPGNPGQFLRLYDLPGALRTRRGRPVRLLVVTNASPDRDGTRRSFGLLVPAAAPDALAAAAATFGLRPEEYRALDRAT